MTPRNDDGLGLPEVIIGLVVSVIAMAGFAALLGAITANQRTIDTVLTADAILQDELATGKTYTFIDVMQAPANTPTPPPCPINGNNLRVSTQAIQPSSSIVRNNTTYTITRQVTWWSTGGTVTCASTPNTYDDIKIVTYTITWNDFNGTPLTRTGTLYVGPHTGQGTPPQVLP